MRHFHLVKAHYWKPTVNIDKVSGICSKPEPALTGNPLQLWAQLPPDMRV